MDCTASSRSRAEQPPASARGFEPLLLLGGALYIGWWFACEWLLPGTFNPVLGRLLVGAWFFASFALVQLAPKLRPHGQTLYCVGALLLLAHYGYLLHHNAGDPNWIVGAYVVVFALCASVSSRRWLFALAACALAGAAVLTALDPPMQQGLFLPGLATILPLCLLGMQQRVRLLEHLSESTARFQSLFDATFEGVAVHDQGVIVDANAAFVEMFGYTREELLGSNAERLTAPEVRELVRTQMKIGAGGRYEAIGVRKDGSRFAIEISGKPHVYRGRALRLAAVRDVSDRQRAQAEHLTRVQEQAARLSAQEAVRMRDEFISIASHELRTPITSLLLNLEVYVPRWRAGQRDFETYATRVRRALGRMKRLVDELFEVSRLDAGKFALSEEPTELGAIVRDVTDAMAEDLRRAQCELTVRSDGPLYGSWDRLRLEQVLENLLRNALIYGAANPIEITLGGEGERAQLSVRDHGIGIARESHERIFLRYGRGVSARNYGGLGLGLYIAKQIVEAHRGTIRVESEPDQGATFTVELPLLEQAALPQARQA